MKRIYIVAILLITIILFIYAINNTQQTKQDASETSRSILNSIDKTYRCETDSDCISPGIWCLNAACWNKNNLPEQPTLGPNEGMCPPPVRVSSCVCEKNRCQPSQEEQDQYNYHFQPCDIDANCFSDEICLGETTISTPRSWNYSYAVKEIDANDKVCYTKCTADEDCPTGMMCQTTKNIPSKVWDTLEPYKTKNWESNWENNTELEQADTVKYCRFLK